MALVQLQGQGLQFPALNNLFWPAGVNATVDAYVDLTGERFAMLGQCFIAGRPAGTKTISAAGGGKVHFSVGSVITWANTSTRLDVGIQDVSTSGPVVQPDGTFDVSHTLIPGTDTLTANTWKTVTMTSGTKSIAHGQLVAIVLDMTTRAGSDAVRLIANAQSSAAGPLVTNSYVGGAWLTTSPNFAPIVLIEFDDGTLATLAGSYPNLGVGTEVFQESTNPDERGLIFEVPFDCKVDSVYAALQLAATDSDFTFKLYSDPLGTPTLIASLAVLAEQGGTINVNRTREWALDAEYSLSKNTPYALTVRATGTANVTLYTTTYQSASYKVFVTNGSTLRKGTRNADAGAFSETSTTIPIMGVRISSIDVSSGGGLAAVPLGGFVR